MAHQETSSILCTDSYLRCIMPRELMMSSGDEYMQQLQEENLRLSANLRRCPLDAAMKKAAQADHLEREWAHCEDELEQLGSCRSRLEEPRRDNQPLRENKEELVGQLDTYKLEEQCGSFSLENKAFQTKTAGLSAVDEELERKLHLTTPTPGSLSSKLRLKPDCLDFFDNNICELERENRRLSTTVESLREGSSHNSSSKILALEKDNKRLELENEDLKSRLAQLEENLSTATKEKQQLRSLLEDLQNVGDNGEMISRIVALESEKQKALRELERTQSSLDTSAKIVQELRIKLKALEKQRDQESDSDDDDVDDLNSSILKSPPKSHNRLRLDLKDIAQTKLKRQSEIVEPTVKKTEHMRLEVPNYFALLSEHLKETNNIP